MASLDLDVTLELVGVGAVSGRLSRVAAGWCLLRGPGQDWIVRHGAVAAVHGGSDRSVPEVAWPTAARLGLRAALRRLAEEAEPCTLHLSDGRRHDGTLARVGDDFVELLAGEAGRVVLVALPHLAAVQSRR
jgi:sugar phosphate isomerase/epimerase